MERRAAGAPPARGLPRRRPRRGAGGSRADRRRALQRDLRDPARHGRLGAAPPAAAAAAALRPRRPARGAPAGSDRAGRRAHAADRRDVRGQTVRRRAVRRHGARPGRRAHHRGPGGPLRGRAPAGRAVDACSCTRPWRGTGRGQRSRRATQRRAAFGRLRAGRHAPRGARPQPPGWPSIPESGAAHDRPRRRTGWATPGIAPEGAGPARLTGDGELAHHRDAGRAGEVATWARPRAVAPTR